MTSRYMKVAIFALIGLVSITATCAMYGWLESTVNMAEGLGQLFAPGATTVLFSPFLLLFILVTVLVFVAMTLFMTVPPAVVGGIALRLSAQRLSRSFARWFVVIAVICQFVFISVSIDQDASFLLHRPGIHSAAPAWLMALLASANAAGDLFLAGLIVRRLADKHEPLSRHSALPI